MADQELHNAELSLERFIRGDVMADGAERVTVVTTRGDILLRYHAPAAGAAAAGAILFGCTEPDQPSPAGGELYPRACRLMAAAGVACAELTLRRPDDFHECVIDVLGAMAFLDEGDAAPVGLVAHSLAAPVALQAALLSPDVGACALLSPVPFEDAEEFLPHLGPRCAALFVHGAVDDLVPVAAARRMFDAASEPKRWITVERAGHDLDAADGPDALAAELAEWVASSLRRPEASAA